MIKGISPEANNSDQATNNKHAVRDNKSIPTENDSRSPLKLSEVEGKPSSKEEFRAACLKEAEELVEKRLHPVNFDCIIGHDDLKSEIILAIAGKLCEDSQSKAYLDSIDDHSVTGILINGPPGVGKSSILRSIDKSLMNHPEIDCRSIDCSDFQGGVGTNAKIINDAFEEARNTPKKCCVMLIDELDSVMRKKKGLLNDAERTNAMQSNMDGMKDSSKIIMIATTNSMDAMEDASLSRFITITLGLPTIDDRKALIKKYIMPIPSENPVNIDIIAKYTDGFTGRQFRDIGKKLNKIRATKRKPLSNEAITLEIMKYMPYSSKNKQTADELNEKNCLNSTITFINNNINKDNPTLYTVDNTLTESCGICGNPLDGQDRKNIGLGLGVIHAKCEYSTIKIKSLINITFCSMNTHEPISANAGDIIEVPAVQALGLISKKAAERIEGA